MVANVLSVTATYKKTKFEESAVNVKELLYELLKIHQLLLPILVEIGQVDTNLFEASGSDMLKFNGQLMGYCKSLEQKMNHKRIRNAASEFVTKLTETQNNIKELEQHYASYDVPDMDAIRARYPRDDDERVQIVKVAPAALQANNEEKCIELCNALVNSLVCKDVTRIDVAILIGGCRSISPKERINFLQDTRETVTSLIDNNGNDRSAKSINLKQEN